MKSDRLKRVKIRAKGVSFKQTNNKRVESSEKSTHYHNKFVGNLITVSQKASNTSKVFIFLSTFPLFMIHKGGNSPVIVQTQRTQRTN